MNGRSSTQNTNKPTQKHNETQTHRRSVYHQRHRLRGAAIDLLPNPNPDSRRTPMHKLIHKTLHHANTPIRLVCRPIKLLPPRVTHCLMGCTIGFVGVFIAKTHTNIIIVHYICDFVGYGLHGLGVAPFVEAGHHYIFRHKQTQQTQKAQTHEIS